MSALQDRMIDTHGRHPLCTHRVLEMPLAEYLVRRGGLSWDVVETMQCPDVHLLAQSIARARYIAEADRTLLELDLPVSPVLLPFTPGSLRTAYVLGALTLLTMLGFCGFLGGLIR